MGVKWKLVSVRLEIVLVVHGLCRTRLGNNFGSTRWNLKLTRVKWNLVSVHLEIVLVLVQDRGTVCSKQGSEIILTTPDGTPR